MTLTDVRVSERQAHQQRVSALLAELEEGRRHIYRLKAGGARRAGLRDQKDELEEARRRLLETVL
jgi:hypothetical protein